MLVRMPYNIAFGSNANAYPHNNGFPDEPEPGVGRIVKKGF